MNEIIQGDCLEVMKTFPENHFSAIVTDPPYGLSFMGKGWDHEVPGKQYWEECLRIAKPGVHLLAMGGTRTSHRLACAIEDAGWEIRDCIVWLHGSGFPKSHNRFGAEGWGTALKPAHEPIIMAMKPCEGTFKQNYQKWGQAGINIDDCRIGSSGSTKRSEQCEYPKNSDGTEDRSQHWARTGHQVIPILKGRWPANVILDEEAGHMLDDQTSHLECGHRNRENHNRIQSHNIYSAIHRNGDFKDYNDSGGASRFFYCAKASSRERNEGLEGLPDRECQTGCSGAMPIDDEGKDRDRFKKIAKNVHPTVKPIKLMEYLIKLVMPPSNGVLLDPFAGSGTTILAAKRLGFNAMGIEKSSEYVEIARGRIGAEEPTQNKDLQLDFA